MTLGHILGGPLDAVIELGIPLAVFVVLWWWSSRSAKTRKEKDGKE